MTDKELLEQQSQVIKDLRKSVEEGKEKSFAELEEMKKNFMKAEEVNQKIVADFEKEKEARAKIEESFKVFEKQYNRLPSGIDASVKEEAVKSFENYLKNKAKKEANFQFNQEDFSYLRTDEASNGGVLVPDTLVSELIKQEIQISPIMENARVINATAKSLTYPIRTTIPSVNRVGEGGTSGKSISNYKNVRLEAYRNDVIVPITREMINFASFNMEEEMRKDAAIALIEQTNIDFLLGNGVSKSEGILVNADVKTLKSGIANDLPADLDLFYTIQGSDNIKQGYLANAKFYMNSNTLFSLATKKTGTGEYLWQPMVANGVPNTICGKPYVLCPNMDNVGVNTYPVFFGDLRQAYYILRAMEVEVVVDPYTAKGEGIIEYQWIEYLGGKVVLPEAIVKIKCAV